MNTAKTNNVMIKPKYATIFQGGIWYDWKSGEFATELLDNRGKYSVIINGQSIHSFAFENPAGCSKLARWDCINGWTVPLEQAKQIQDNPAVTLPSTPAPNLEREIEYFLDEWRALPQKINLAFARPKTATRQRKPEELCGFTKAVLDALRYAVANPDGTKTQTALLKRGAFIDNRFCAAYYPQNMVILYTLLDMYSIQRGLSGNLPIAVLLCFDYDSTIPCLLKTFYATLQQSRYTGRNRQFYGQFADIYIPCEYRNKEQNNV